MSPALHFARPEAWPLLLVAPLVGLVLWLRGRARQRRLLAVAGPRAAALGGERNAARRAIGRGATTLGLLLAGAAALHPVWGPEEGAEEERGVDLVVCLDVSRSMLARDVAPDRLGRAKAEIRALAGAAQGDRLGLVLFAGEARPFVPLTEDLASFAHMADLAETTSVRRGGTDLGAAIDQGLALLEGGRDAEGPGVLLLLTDGEDLGGEGAAAAERARRRGVAVHTVGYGTPLGGKVLLPGEGGDAFLRDRAGREVVSALDTAGLRRIAAISGGVHAGGEEGSVALLALYQERIRPLAREASASRHRKGSVDRFQAPLLAAVLLGLLAFGLSERRRRRPLLLPHAAARAASLVLVLLLPGLPSCGAAADRDPADALAALRGERWDEAATLAARMVESPDPGVLGMGYFVRGNVAFARSVAVEAEAARPGGDATAHERATAFAEDALAAWRMAAASREDWPEARRNVERAILRLDRLRERRSSGGGRPKDLVPVPGSPPKPPEPPEKPPPPPPPETGPGEPSEDERTAVAATELAPGEVARLFEVLRQKEQEKRRLREAERTAGAGTASGVEKDW